MKSFIAVDGDPLELDGDEWKAGIIAEWSSEVDEATLFDINRCMETLELFMTGAFGGGPASAANVVGRPKQVPIIEI